jgi:hypothetical protein
MTTVTIGQWTLEHDREWRAWRRLVTGDVIQKGDEYDLGGRWVAATKFDRTYNAGGGWLPYRRPVPLPSIDPELVDACQFAPGKWSFEHWMYRDDDGRAELVKMLKHRLPGYEEQLAKVSVNTVSMMFRWADGERPTEPQAPVPADGWRPIETIVPAEDEEWIVSDGTTRWIGHFVDYDLTDWVQRTGQHVYPSVKYRGWLSDAGDAISPTLYLMRLPPLPPPPQEKGGEA